MAVTRGVANVAADGRVEALDSPSDAAERVSADDIANTMTLARLLTRLLRDVADLRRRWWPRRTDFVDVAVGSGGAQVRLDHGMGGRVRWWVTDATVAHALTRDAAATTADTLVLQSNAAGVVTIRVEEAGGGG